MIEQAEKDGALTPRSGQIILESSSGNTGIALAMIARTRGYRFKVVLPENVSVERRQLLEVWGAEIIDSPGSEGSNGAMRRAQAMAAEQPDWWFPFQYGNEANPRAHYETTGPEIWRDAPELTHFTRRARHRRHADGHRQVPQGAQPRRPDLGRSSRRPGRWSTASRTSTRGSSRRCSSTTTATSSSTGG